MPSIAPGLNVGGISAAAGPGRRVVMLGLLVGLAGPAVAQPLRLAPREDHRQLAIRVMDALGAPVLFERTLPDLRQGTIALLQRHGMTAEDAAQAVDRLILPEFRDRRRELIEAMSAPLYRAFTEDELAAVLRILAQPIMQRERDATMGGPPLGLREKAQLVLLRWREPLLRRFTERMDALQTEIGTIGRTVGGRIGEQAIRKNIAMLRYNGLRD